MAISKEKRKALENIGYREGVSRPKNLQMVRGSQAVEKVGQAAKKMSKKRGGNAPRIKGISPPQNLGTQTALRKQSVLRKVRKDKVIDKVKVYKNPGNK
jgi:hypothetical protein